MVDKTSHQFDNMDGIPVPDAGSSDSRISANILGYDIKGGTNQNSTNISLPQENIDSSKNSNNSTAHLMPLFYSNKLVFFSSTALKLSSAIILTTVAIMTTVRRQRHHWVRIAE